MWLGVQHASAEHVSISRVCFIHSTRFDEGCDYVILYQQLVDGPVGFNQQHDDRSHLARETLRLSRIWSRC